MAEKLNPFEIAQTPLDGSSRAFGVGQSYP